jgi:hypothetical protein
MKRTIFAIVLLLPLCGCDDPEARKLLAQCELSREARVPNFDHYDWHYLEKCMQAKGYVEDGNLSRADGIKCRDTLWSDEEAACYRSDNTISKWFAHL